MREDDVNFRYVLRAGNLVDVFIRSPSDSRIDISSDRYECDMHFSSNEFMRSILDPESGEIRMAFSRQIGKYSIWFVTNYKNVHAIHEDGSENPCFFTQGDVDKVGIYDPSKYDLIPI